MNNLFKLILKGIGLAMGIAVIVLSILKKIEIYPALTLLGIGISSISLLLLNEIDK